MIHDGRENFGGYLEDFVTGDIYKHWPGKTVTEADNHLFSLITMNSSPLHIDEAYMAEHQHGQILVVGPLVISLLVGMSVRDTSGKVRKDHPRCAGLPRRYDIWRVRDTGDSRVSVSSRPRNRIYGEPGVQSGRRQGRDSPPPLPGPEASLERCEKMGV